MQGSSVAFHLTQQESLLADAVARLQFGELLQVAYIQEPVALEQHVSVKTRNMILALRRVGGFNKVTIHEGEPTAAEYVTTVNGIQAIKKIKF